MKSQDLKKLNLPNKSGVYFWKRGSEILYIGKATSLRDRVRSYFAKDLIDTRGPGILDMVTISDTVTFQETDSVLEALILEANLIKKFQPKYNVKEKDDKSFNTVAITKDPFPQVIIVREREAKLKKFNAIFGPYPNSTLLRDALKIIRKIFPFMDENAAKKDQYEFYRQIGLVPSSAKKEYIKNIRNIKLFLSGKKNQVIKSLEKEMHLHAKRHEFELADIAKKKIFALQHINDVALIKDEVHQTGEGFRIESYDIAHLSGKNTVGVMTVVTNGRVDKSEYRKFIIRSGKGNDDYGNLKEVLTRRFNHPEWPLPNLIVVDGGLGQYNAFLELVKSIPLVSVIKDDKHKPKGFHGDPDIIQKHKKEILLANNESHRFAITFHKQKRSKDFLGK